MGWVTTAPDRGKSEKTCQIIDAALKTLGFVGRHKERVLMEDPADDNHRVRAHDVDDCVTTKLCEVVNTNHRVLVTRPHVVHAGFEFYEIVYMRSIRRPVHLADDTAQAEIALRRSQLLEHVEHPVLIEPAIPKV